MELNNFKIVKLDDCNITFEEYRKIESKKDNTQYFKWVRVGGYYATFERCLKALKEYIINSYVDLENYNEVLEKINELNNSIVKCEIKKEVIKNE